MNPDNDFFFDQLGSPVDEPVPTRGAKLRALSVMPLVAALSGVAVAGLGLPVAWTGAAAASTAASIWQAIPDELPATPAAQRSVMLDANGHVFARFWTENRTNVDAAHISKAMDDAQVSIEDTRFWTRPGVADVRALGRVALSGGGSGGGSTITQQYVKNVLMNAASSTDEYNEVTAHTPVRKLREMKLASRVERTMSKSDILTGYLNIANYGDGTYGVEAAAEHYFGVHASQLDARQAATLAGIVQNPSRNPVADPAHALLRRNEVLRAMHAAGRITDAQYDAARRAPLGLHVVQPASGCASSAYPYYCTKVEQVLRNNPAFGTTQAARDRVLFRGGLTVHTALDPKAMAAADRAAHDALGNHNQFATGIAFVQPGTGKVLGVGQNRSFGQTQVLYADSGFQNGSTFKPITLAAALENGWDISRTLYAPPHLYVHGVGFGNQSAHDAGTMDAANALAVSSNTFFVRLETEATTVADTQRMANRLGLDLPDDLTGTEASTTLGVYNVSPVQVANAYATFAAHGVYCKPVWVTSVTGPEGTMTPDAGCHQELEPGVADTIANALTTVVDGPNPNRTGAKMSLGRPLMGKTGTTTKNSAVWFAGGTPQVTEAVWVGDPRGGFKYPVDMVDLYGSWMGGVAGSTTAGPIWRQAMAAELKGMAVQRFSLPSTVHQKVVVPDVRRLTLASAIAVAQQAHMAVSVQRATAGDAPSGTVTGQSPVPGSPLPRSGATMVLTLSKGSDTHVAAVPAR